MKTNSRLACASLSGLLGLLAAAAPACSKKAPPPPPGAASGPRLKTLSVAEARPRLMASISAPGLDGTLERVAAIAKDAVGFPFDAKGLRDSLMSTGSLPPTVAAHLDLGQPVGIAVVSMGGKGVKAATAIAVSARSADAARQAVTSLGAPVEKREDAVAVDTQGRKTWLLQRDGVIIAAETIEGLTAAAESALDARRAGTEDLTARIFPDGLAADQGTDVATGLRTMMDGIRESQRQLVGQSKVDPEAEALVNAVVEVVLARVAQTASAEVGIAVDAKRGATVAVRLRARPGTDLAGSAKERMPYVLDPSTVAPDLAGAGAAGSSRFVLQVMEAMKTALDKLPASRDAGKAVGDLMASMTGVVSGSLRFGKAGLSYDYVYGLEDEASGQVALDGIAGFIGSSFFKRLMTAASGKGDKQQIDVKREKIGGLPGLRILMDYGLGSTMKGMPRSQANAIKALIGSSKQEILVVAAGRRLVSSAGTDAKTRIAAMIAGKGGQPSAELGTAIADTSGHDAFGFMDMSALLRPALSLMGDPRLDAALKPEATAAVPMYFSYRGDGRGEVLTGELRLPLAAVAGGGKLAGHVTSGGAGPK